MFEKQDKSKKFKKGLFAVLFLSLGGALAFLLFTRMEGEKPLIQLGHQLENVPADFEISGSVEDRKSGIKEIRISILQKDREALIYQKEYPRIGFLQNGNTHQASFKLRVSSKTLHLEDGPAKLNIRVKDYAWRNGWHGNQTCLKQDIVFDTRPPVLSVLSHQHNGEAGGSGLMIYKLSEPCPQSGVMIGDDFFPGYPGHFKDRSVYLAFFAIPLDYSAAEAFFAKAVDSAGNSTRTEFYHHIRKRRRKSDTINISERFLSRKLPEFQSIDGFPVDQPAKEQFVFINTVLREANNRRILSNGRKTSPQLLWENAFGRLPNAARKANFADHRTYFYQGQEISRAVHMGIDLASIKHAEVPAANRGRVVFADRVGIYGNLVCIDHGCGLMSIYAHLSRIVVRTDEMIAKGETIAYTGISGLAGGDHLHFGILIDHMFVDPVEWWDPLWIKNNITDKIGMAQSMLQ